MSKFSWRRCALAVALSLAALPAFAAGISVEIGNGDQVEGELSDVDDVQRFRVFVPEGAKLIATVKGLKAKGETAPTMSLRILDDTEFDVSDGLVKQKKTGAKAKVPVEFTGEHIVEVFGDGASTGRFKVTAKWSSPGKFKIKDEELFDEGDETTVYASVDGDARVTMSVKAVGRSNAKPFFDYIEYDDAIDVDEEIYEQDLDDGPKQKNVLILGRGDIGIVIGNASGEGPIGGSIKVKAPKSARRKIVITNAEIQSEDGPKAAVGGIVSPAKSSLIETDDEEIVGDSLGIASVLVPPGAVTSPTAILIGSSPGLPPPPASGLAGAGPTVFFGPSGLQFLTDVTVTIPFDPDLLEGDDTSGLQVFTRDENGNVSEIVDFTVNLDDGTVSFPVSHFSSFRVFISRPPAPFDLNGDGINDLALPAPGFGSGHVYVFFGPLDDASGELSTADADVTIAGDGVSDGFGRALTVGDVNGDGEPDLLVLGKEVLDGSLHVYFGGPGFAPTQVDDDDILIEGAVGDEGFQDVVVGDLNDDGIGDIVLSAENGPSGKGDVWVFFGATTWTDHTTSAANVRLTGEQTGDLFGAELVVGDVTGDGKTDLLVGADMIDNPGRSGAVYVFPGGAGFSPTITGGILFTGSGADAGFGLNIAVGDVTGDGVPDFIASEFDDILGGPGRVYVFRGGATLATGGTSDAIASFLGDGTEDLLGSSLAIADVNGDGVGDLVLGASGVQSSDGALFVVDGGSLSGEDNSPGTSAVFGEGFLEGFPRLAPPRRLNGSTAVIAFAPGNEDGGLSAGAAYVFLTNPTPGSTADVADIVIRGQGDDLLGGEGD